MNSHCITEAPASSCRIVWRAGRLSGSGNIFTHSALIRSRYCMSLTKKVMNTMSSVEPPAFSITARTCWKINAAWRSGSGATACVAGSAPKMPPVCTMLPTFEAKGIGFEWPIPSRSIDCRRFAIHALLVWVRAGASAAAQARVEHVAQRVAQHIESEDGERDRHARPHRQQRRPVDEARGVAAQHLAPGWDRRRNAEAEKADDRLDQDHG